MTRLYDTGNTSTIASPLTKCNARGLEAIDHGGSYINIFVYISTAYEIVYAYGDGNSFTETTITGSGSVLDYDADNIDYVALACDHNNDYVHIAFVADDKVYHARLTDPDDPSTAGDWTTYGATKYQRVDNSSYVKGQPSITVDSSTGSNGVNGADKPHIAWHELDTGSALYEVHYNYGNGTDGAFTNTSEITIDAAGAMCPCIHDINEEERRLYLVYSTYSAPTVKALRCLDANSPLTVGNWVGPQSGTTTPDVLFAGGNAIIYPNITHYWDTDERVYVVGATYDSTTSAGYAWTQVYYDNTGSWHAAHIVAQHSTVLDAVGTLVLSNHLRVTLMLSGGWLWHAREAPEANEDIYFDANTTWYRVYDQAFEEAVRFTCEWKGLEHADGALGYRRTHAVAVFNVGDAIYFLQLRENTPLINAQTAPVDGTEHRCKLSYDILLDWSLTDTESDGQSHYYAQVDDDPYFGSPTVDTGWTASATSSHNIIGGTLTGDKLYYWRIKTRDGELGDYGDEYRTEDWSTDLRYFNTTKNVEIYYEDLEQQSDKDVYIQIRIKSNLAISAELYDGSNFYADYSTDGGLNWNTLSYTYIRTAECTSTPAGPITTSAYPGTPYTLAWDASNASQLGTSFSGDVRVRLKVRYDADSEGLGWSGWFTSTDYPIDYSAPTVTLGWPSGYDIVDATPTLTATITDENGFDSQFQVDNNSDLLSPEYDSGWVDSAESYTVPAALSTGTWYFQCRARDKTASQNTSSWSTGSFVILQGCFVPKILSDGTNTISLNIEGKMDIFLENNLVEYDTISNTYDSATHDRNIPEYRGHKPLEIVFDVVFLMSSTDYRRLHTWMNSNTRLFFMDISDNIISVGLNTIQEYKPENWRVVALKELYTPGSPRLQKYKVTLREVAPQ